MISTESRAAVAPTVHRWRLVRILRLFNLVIVNLALVACGASNKDHKVALHKTIDPRGVGARARGGCPLFADRLKHLREHVDGFVLHTSDYELKGADGPSAELLNFRVLRGPGAPILQTGTSLDDLIFAPPLAGLLAIGDQTGCAAVTFATGDVFRVTESTAASVTMVNADSGETRAYTFGENELLIKDAFERQIGECDGTKASARTESVTYRLAWGESAGQIKLSAAMADALNAPIPTTEVAPKATPKRRVLTPRPVLRTTTLSVLAFQKLLKDADARAAALTCPR